MSTLVRQLRSWQLREGLYSACVAVAAVALVVVVGLLLACGIDYTIDSETDTPFWVRVMLTAGQVVGYLAVVYFAARWVRPPSLDVLAGRAEKAHPAFDHRLVTTLQLNRPTARTAGMSSQLIAAVTAEAGTMVARHRLARLADPHRLLWAVGLLIPPLLITGAAFVFYRPLATALLQRQLLMDVEIPRSVSIESVTPPLFPAGDAVEVRVAVRGRVSDTTAGRLHVFPANGARETHELTFVKAVDETTSLFAATLPPASDPFTFTARVKDGRMKAPAAVAYAPRPVVTDVAAWVLSPAYVDPAGKRRYEKMTNQGDVACHADCSVRVRAAVSKPVRAAALVLTGKGVEDRRPMALDADGTTATAQFDIPSGVNAYRIEVTDENGFANLTPPRRGIAVLPDRPPLVTLTDEVLMPAWETGPLDDFEVRGMPLVVGGQIQIGYSARSPLGLDKAFVVYRVNDGPWVGLPLTPVDADEAAVGKFRPELGVFATYDVDKNVEFYPLPTPDPDAEPPGLTAGGRYNFQTAALSKVGPNGANAALEVGDRVEFRVGVYDRKPDRRIPITDLDAVTQLAEKKGGADRPAGYSESRIKTVVTQAAFDQWRDQQARSRERLREIEKMQRGVFGQRDDR